MWAFLKKDLLVITRNKSELLFLLLMPFILIAILGFALRGVMGGDPVALDIDVAIVMEDDEQSGVDQFVQNLEAMDIPLEDQYELRGSAEAIRPYSVLMELLQQDELGDIIDMQQMDAQSARQALERDDVSVVLTIPEQFTYDMLQQVLLNEGEGSDLHVMVADYGSLHAQVFHQIIDRFVHTWNMETAIGQAMAADGVVEAGDERVTEEGLAGSGPGVAEHIEVGGVESVTAQEPVSSMQYYTIGMAVMFVLYSAGSVSGRTQAEKTEHVFSRILLSGRPPLLFLVGKGLSTMIVAFLQLGILFALSALIFRTFTFDSVSFWFGMALISGLMAICVGGVAMLLTALNLRFNGEIVTTVFMGGLVSIFAFAGGSMFPVHDMSDVVQTIGNWTPNGAALSAYLQWMQGAGLDAVSGLLGRITVVAVLCGLISVLLYPQRRAVGS